MEKTFLRMKTRPSARRAYVQAEVVSALSLQIRSIRLDRGWTQGDLAKKLGTTQAAISRLEDASYGRATLKTLLELAAVFDSGLEVRFTSLLTMLNETFVPDPRRNHVPSFEEEAPHVCFYTLGSRTDLPAPPTTSTVPSFLNFELTHASAVMQAQTITLPASKTLVGAKTYG